jgi:hypothetical protein
VDEKSFTLTAPTKKKKPWTTRYILCGPSELLGSTPKLRD